MKLSIIIPLYNEERYILSTLKKVEEVIIPKSINDVEIIVIDDCSKDNSWQIINEYVKNKENVKLFRHDVNKGKGAAMRTGIANCTGDLVVFQDADLELSPEDIPVMIDTMIKLDVDFVNGSRYLSGVPRPLSSFWRYIGNKIFTLLTAMIINVKISDMACGYKLVKKDLLDKLNLKENRFGIEAEIMIKALRFKKERIAEVPVQYLPRTQQEGKKIRNSDAFKIFYKILKYGLFKAS
ncbi:MAG TPA: glycosyltransferase family 2 protein [Bacteroidales bacterium]|nr:glycosyltransferase family 2 protein [Bacteroidales bacterium]